MPLLAAELVEGLEHAAGSERLAVDRDAVAPLEIQLDVLGLVGRVLGRDRQLEHALVLLGRRVEPRILENAGLVGNVQKIAVHRVRLLERGSTGMLCFWQYAIISARPGKSSR